MRTSSRGPIDWGTRWLGLVSTLDPARAKLWAGRGFWAFADQGLFAGTNFIVGVLLARWLEPVAYGAFSTAYAGFLLVGTLHSALWTEPMVVYGSGRFSNAFDAYCRVLLRYHWRFGVGIALAFLLAGGTFGVVGEEGLGRSLGAFCFAAPCILYLWLVRRSAYVILEPRLAAYGGALYLVLFLGSALALWRTGLLADWNAILAMGAMALVAGRFVRDTVRKRVGASRPADPAEVRALHWSYGRWAMVASTLAWVPANIYFIVLPAFHGFEVAAAFKALTNLVMPILHFNGAIVALFVPAFVQAAPQGRLIASALKALVCLLVPAVAFWIVLHAAGAMVMEWLYAGKYEGSQLLAWLGFVGVGTAVSGTFAAVLRALERPERVAAVCAVNALVAVSGGVGLVYIAGVDGAVIALATVSLVSAAMMAASAVLTVRAGGDAVGLDNTRYCGGGGSNPSGDGMVPSDKRDGPERLCNGLRDTGASRGAPPSAERHDAEVVPWESDGCRSLQSPHSRKDTGLARGDFSGGRANGR